MEELKERIKTNRKEQQSKKTFFIGAVISTADTISSLFKPILIDKHISFITIDTKKGD